MLGNKRTIETFVPRMGENLFTFHWLMRDTPKKGKEKG